MAKHPDIEGVVSAFELLREQLQETKTRIGDRVVHAAQAGEFDDVRELIEKAEGLDRIVDQADTLLVEFDHLFGQPPVAEPPEPPPEPQPPSAPRGSIRLVLNNKHCDARAIYSGGSVVVLSGSTLALNERESLSDVCRAHRQDLKRHGQLTRDLSGHALVLHTDCHFKSPSGAACFVVGYSANGKLVWTVAGTGETLGERLDAAGA